MKKILYLILAFISTPVFATNYKIDPTHTQIIFKIKHLAISTVTGNFSTFEGSFEFDPEKISESKTSVKINSDSIDTSNQKRDEHLKNQDFFDVVKFPEISFVSKEIKDIDGKNFTIVGDLTIHGVTKMVVLKTEYNGSATDPWGNERAAFSAEAKINRKDFGLTYNKLLETGGLVIGEDVKILIEIEGIKAK